MSGTSTTDPSLEVAAVMAEAERQYVQEEQSAKHDNQCDPFHSSSPSFAASLEGDSLLRMLI